MPPVDHKFNLDKFSKEDWQKAYEEFDYYLKNDLASPSDAQFVYADTIGKKLFKSVNPNVPTYDIAMALFMFGVILGAILAENKTKNPLLGSNFGR